MQFLCIIIANCLPIICQSALSFYYIPYIAAIATNYSDLLHQCFTNHYQSDPVLYISSLPMIINIFQFIITSHSIDKFFPIGSQYFTNHQFTNDTGKFTNRYQWFIIGSYWQWYMDEWGWGGGLLNRQNQLSMTKVICRKSLSINSHHNFWNP